MSTFSVKMGKGTITLGKFPIEQSIDLGML